MISHAVSHAVTVRARRCAGAMALLPLLATGAVAADGIPAGLKLTAGKVETDAAGAFVSVAVANGTATTFGQIIVSCSFTGGGQTLGTSSTTLFSTVGGTTGNDQVRLMGATSATAAACEITRAQ